MVWAGIRWEAVGMLEGGRGRKLHKRSGSPRGCQAEEYKNTQQKPVEVPPQRNRKPVCINGHAD